MCVLSFRGNEGLKWAKRVRNNNQVREEIKMQRNPPPAELDTSIPSCVWICCVCVCIILIQRACRPNSSPKQRKVRESYKSFFRQTGQTLSPLFLRKTFPRCGVIKRCCDCRIHMVTRCDELPKTQFVWFAYQ